MHNWPSSSTGLPVKPAAGLEMCNILNTNRLAIRPGQEMIVMHRLHHKSSYRGCHTVQNALTDMRPTPPLGFAAVLD